MHHRFCILLTLLLLMAGSSFAQGQKNSRSLPGNYVHSDGDFYYRLSLYADARFTYEMHSPPGTTRAEGFWTEQNGRVKLYGFPQRVCITEFYESRVDSLAGELRIWVLGPSESGIVPLADFPIRVNDQCMDEMLTDSSGMLRLPATELENISIGYDAYTVRDSNSNCFTLVLDTGLYIQYSPPDFHESEWTAGPGTLSFAGCAGQYKLVLRKQGRGKASLIH
ncbi:MAG: hypothetical protein IBJ09_07385 [Bacteroidia bacterium]|nr:hypothetical protein [Bacteroidia bacterium]